MTVLNRVLCALLALAVLAAGLLVAAEILAAGLDRGPWIVPYDRWQRTLRTTPWSDLAVRLVSAGMVVVGVVILVLQAWRRRPGALVLAPTAGGAAARLDRRRAEQWLSEHLGRVDGVGSAAVRLDAKVARVRARTTEADPSATERRLRDDLDHQLERLGLESRLRTKLDVHRATPAPTRRR